MAFKQALGLFLFGLVFSLMLNTRALAQVNTAEPDFWVLTSLEPPFSLRNERGQLEGYLIEVVQGILAEADIQQEILAAPWERLIQESKNKPNVLVFPLARTPEREEDFHWVLPLTSNVYGVLGNPSSDKPIATLSDVNNVTPIGVLESDFRHKVLIAENIRDVAPYDDYDSAVSHILAGKLRSLFFSDAGLRYFCFKQDADCSRFELLYQYDVLTSYIAMSKNSDTRHIDKLNAAAERFLNSAEFHRIQQNWLTRLQEQGPFKLHIENGVLNLW